MDNGAKQKGIMRVKLKFTCYMLILITTAKKSKNNNKRMVKMGTNVPTNTIRENVMENGQ